jgi:hypothetical protein
MARPWHPREARLKLVDIQALPPSDGLMALAEDYADDPSAPDGIVGFLRTAAKEISMSRSEIRRLAAEMEMIKKERDLLAGGMGPGNWPNDPQSSRKLRTFRADRVRQDRDHWRSNYEQQKARADRLAKRLADVEIVARKAGALIPLDGGPVPAVISKRVRRLLDSIT